MCVLSVSAADLFFAVSFRSALLIYSFIVMEARGTASDGPHLSAGEEGTETTEAMPANGDEQVHAAEV